MNSEWNLCNKMGQLQPTFETRRTTAKNQSNMWWSGQQYLQAFHISQPGRSVKRVSAEKLCTVNHMFDINRTIHIMF